MSRAFSILRLHRMDKPIEAMVEKARQKEEDSESKADGSSGQAKEGQA